MTIQIATVSQHRAVGVSDGMPFGVQFLGRPFTEPALIRLASGYEATMHHRKAPASTPPLAGETIGR